MRCPQRSRIGATRRACCLLHRGAEPAAVQGVRLRPVAQCTCATWLLCRPVLRYLSRLARALLLPLPLILPLWLLYISLIVACYEPARRLLSSAVPVRSRCCVIGIVQTLPAYVRVFGHVLSGSSGATALANKSFFRANRVDMLWNCSGSVMLACASSDVDATGKSYYGESNLYFVSGNGDLDCTVPLGREGPVYSVQWSPTGREFVVVHGCAWVSAVQRWVCSLPGRI